VTGTATVTLLFTDLAGSTELLSRLGDEAADDLRRRHFELLREAALSHGGHEVKTLGDGVMVAFPSALAGVSCAVAMQMRIARNNAEHPDRHLGLRVGVNVGEAVSEEDDYFGTPVVVAKRLCDRATPGEILVSQVVRALVGSRGDYRFTDLGALSLKGLADPVAASRLEWDSGLSVAHREQHARDGQVAAPDFAPDEDRLPFPAALAAEARGRIVGREIQLARLVEELETARAGRRRLVLLAGEPGIGKTRLAAELASVAHERGAVVLYGRCSEETLVPFQPFVEALGQYVAQCSLPELRRSLGDGGGELARLLPELRRRLPALPEPAPGDSDTERYRLFEAAGSLLFATAHQSPAVLVLDDLHWADKPTLLLLSHIMRSAEQAPLLIVGTYRDVELTRSHPLAETLGDLRRERLFERLALEGLSEEDVAILIGAWAGQDPPAEFAHAVWRETEGHPFFVQELLRHLLETGAIRERHGHLAPKGSLKRMGIPEGVKDVIERRLARLDEATNRVLSVAAVIGRDFPVDLLEHVCEVSGERLFELLEAAAAARVIVVAPGASERYSFSHALIRATLYDDMTAPHRVRLHQRIGDALEALQDGDRDVRFGELAHHYFEAAAGSDALGKAIEYAEYAGLYAAGQLAYEEAAAHYERAVHGLALKGGDDSRRCTLMLALGENQWNAGEFVLARQTFRQAGELAERLGLADELARAALGLGGGFAHALGMVDPVLTAMLERALALAGDQDGALRAQLLARLAEALALTPQRDRAAVLAEQAEQMARRIGDPAVLASVLIRGLWARVGPDAVDEQLGTAREIKRLAQEAGSEGALYEGYAWEIGALLKRGEIASARTAQEEHARIAERLRQPYYLWLAAAHQAADTFLEQPVSEIERAVARTVEIGQTTQNPTAVELFGAQIMFVRLFQGRAAELRAAARGFADAVGIPGWRCGLALVCCEMGRDDEARRELERMAVNDFAEIQRDLFWLTCLELLADVCAHLGDTRRAAALYELLAPYEDCYVVLAEWAVPRGSVARPLGVLAATMGRFDQAAAHFEKALERDAQTGSAHAVAKARCDYATMLLDRAAPGDRERALALLDEACAAAERLEMTAVVDKATALRQEDAGDDEPFSERRRARLSERAARFTSEARAAVSTRGRDTLGKLLGDVSDDALDRRFGSPLAERALLTAMARSYQPRLAFGFQGEIQYEFTHPPGADGERPSDWWTIRIDGTRAVARHRTAHNPAVTVHLSVPTFVRIFSGEDDPVAAMLEGRVTAEGDLVLGARLTEMFGAVSPSDVLAPTG
jgi:class 3 adenylate cyclase/tetratricopeptide (TPR) repeat protein